MKHTIQVTIRRGEHKYVAECADLPIVTEAETLDELAAHIRECVELFLDGEDAAEYGLAARPVILATLELETAA